MKDNECENYRLIKNPFVCKTSAPIRLTLDKQPLNRTGNTQYIRTATLHNGNKKMINELDSKLSYDFGIEKDDTEYTPIDKYDYEVPADILNKSSKKEHKVGLPLSFINITTEEEGIEWYSKHYPKIPDDLLPIIARYHWGEPITKKSIKNEKKKIEKKLNKAGLVVENKKVELKFD
jgi:hypothetical protein